MMQTNKYKEVIKGPRKPLPPVHSNNNIAPHSIETSKRGEEVTCFQSSE
jgi:hypothetical protein